MNQMPVTRVALVAEPGAVDLGQFEVRGNPTDEELLAAVTALLAVLDAPPPQPPPRWRSRPVPPPSVLPRGAGAWRAGGWS